MLGDGKPNSGTQGSYWRYQYGVLRLLEEINKSINALPGVDYETRTTTYEAIENGAGYSIGNIIVRYDIIDVAAESVISTLWFNQSTQGVIAAPASGHIIPYSPPGDVTVTNPFNLEVTQLLVLAKITDIFNTIHTEEDDNAIPEGLTLPTSIVELYGNWDGAWQRLTTDGNNRLVIAANSLPLPTGAATQGTLSSVDTNTATIAGDTTSLDSKVNNDYGVSTDAVRTAAQVGNATGEADFNIGVPGAQTLRTTEAYVTRTPTMLRATAAAAATILAGTRSVAFFNASSTALATVLGTVLKQGEQVSFEPGMNDILPEIAYNADSTNAGGGDLLITYVS